MLSIVKLAIFIRNFRGDSTNAGLGRDEEKKEG